MADHLQFIFFLISIISQNADFPSHTDCVVHMIICLLRLALI